MLDRKTVFVIGAGAGFDIGMPLGEELAGRIAKAVNFNLGRDDPMNSDQQEILNALYRIAEQRRADINTFVEAGHMISKGIRYTDSIDNYVHSHSDKEAVKDVAKVAIVYTILAAEARSAISVDGTRHPPRFRDEDKAYASWLTGFFGILQSGMIEAENIQDIFNNLTIINFNYDRCVEHFLYQVMQRLYPTKGEGFVVELLNSTLKVIHPYGKVGNLPWQSRERAVHFGAQRGADDLVMLSNQIRTFNEEIEDKGRLAEIRKCVADANRMVFLGFHFHKQNVELLAQEKGKPDLRGTASVYATRVDRSDADMEIVRNRISTALHGRTLLPSSVINREYDCKKFFKDFAMTLTG